MARPLELLLSLGLTFYALTRMTKVSDFMWERRVVVASLASVSSNAHG